jgi:uncharacterized membrane protein
MQRLRPLLQYFFQGLIILAPIVLTAWAVISLFNFIDGILPNLLNTLFPSMVGVDANGDPKRYPGLGFLVVIAIVILIGYLSSSFVFGRIVHFFDLLLEKTPGVKVIYTALKDFFEAFAGNKKKFNRAVLVCIEAEDVWQLGFVTQQDVHEFGLHEYVSVYIPHSYAFSGRMYFVKRDRIRVVDHMNATEAMKFAISGGVAEAEESKD